MRAGHATASTDTGHVGTTSEASFALGHPEKLTDYAYRAVHEMTVKAIAISSPAMVTDSSQTILLERLLDCGVAWWL